ncbi:MAG: hypothetical protein ACTFAL_13990 [Candidatus Electronema sp. V4]|uniref:hypothetical protein n=1 Tax=Candidatus Electronema sp. V4 TaxID=3454756 RepID=UPI00405594A5
MMPQSCCVFPDTLPKDETLFPLVQFFADAVYLAAAENDLPGADEVPPLAGWLMTQGRLRFHCPAPLGVDRERFLRLIKELRQRPGDYVSLSLAGNGGSGTESQDAIVSAVRRQGGGATEEDKERAALLWQARLVLKLGESADRQEEEIRQSLRRITLREQGLLRTLRDEEAAALLAAQELPASDSRRARLRLKAWRQLLACGSQPLPACVFVTADRDAFDGIMEEHGATAQTLFELPLPAWYAGCNFAEKRAALRQEAVALISGLPDSFDKKAWETLLEQLYPKAKHGRCLLSFHQKQDEDGGQNFFGSIDQ